MSEATFSETNLLVSEPDAAAVEARRGRQKFSSKGHHPGMEPLLFSGTPDRKDSGFIVTRGPLHGVFGRRRGPVSCICQSEPACSVLLGMKM